MAARLGDEMERRYNYTIAPNNRTVHWMSIQRPYIRQQGMHSDELSQINRRLFEEQRARYWVSRARRQLGLE